MKIFKEEDTVTNEQTNNKSEINEQRKIKQQVPWLAIFTSPPVLANGVARFAGGFGVFLLQTKLPAYLQDVLHISLTTVIIKQLIIIRRAINL